MQGLILVVMDLLYSPFNAGAQGQHVLIRGLHLLVPSNVSEVWNCLPVLELRHVHLLTFSICLDYIIICSAILSVQA